MFQKGGQAHLKRLRKPFDGRRAAQKPADDSAPCRVGERVKNRIERRCLVCHMVNHGKWFSIWQTDFRRCVKKGRPAGQPFVRWSGLAHRPPRSDEHTSEHQSLMRISYAVSCLK